MNRAWMGAALLAAFLMSSCDNLGDFERAREDFHYSYPMQPGGSLDLDNVNGSVDIAGWDRNTIDVSGTKFAPTDERLREISIKVSVSGSNASVATQAPRDFIQGPYGARYVIRVPSRVALGLAKTTNGGITVEDLQGGGRVSSTNGHISLARDTGDYEVQTTNGSIDLEECSGSERAHTTNGSIRGRLRAGALQAHSTNGGIDLTIMKPQDGEPIRASTTNGGITLALAEFHDNALTAETTHGNVTIRLPSDANARVSAHTTLSHITNDLSLSSEDISKHRIEGQLGKGGPLISATTTTGSVHLERY